MARVENTVMINYLWLSTTVLAKVGNAFNELTFIKVQTGNKTQQAMEQYSK